jgi:hypothetical protein
MTMVILKSMGAAAMAFVGLSFGDAQVGALFRVHCGGTAFVDKAGHFWEADAHYEGGSTFGSDSAILNTDMPGLYRTERWNDTAQGQLKYTFNVASAGDYKVILHFAEIYDGAFAQGKRVFDVLINDAVVAADVDIFAQAGANTPLITDYLTTAQEGKITVSFVNKVNNAKVSGIEVLPQNPFRAAAAPYRIHCGGDDYIDPDGNYWEGDGHFTGGSAVYVSANPVSNTDKSILYQTERFNGSNDLVYSFDVAEGAYDVKLHFAEIFFQDSGKRAFSVDLNGAPVIENLDLVAEDGANTAVVKTFGANAMDGKITLAFRNGIENAKISAIEILPATPVRVRSAPMGTGSSESFRILPAAPGSLSLMETRGMRLAVSVRDMKGKRVAAWSGTGAHTVTGLLPGMYLVEGRSGGRAFGKSVPILR